MFVTSKKHSFRCATVAVWKIHILYFDYWTFVSKKSDKGEEADEEEVTIPFPNLMDISKQFEQGGIGLSKEETYRIFLALKQLSQSHEPKLASVKLWGKNFHSFPYCICIIGWSYQEKYLVLKLITS